MKRIKIFIFQNLFLLTSVLFFSGCLSLLDDDGRIPKDSSYVKVVHYGTTREDRCENHNCPDKQYRLDSGNSHTEDNVKYGRAVIRIPYAKKVGGTSGMSLEALEHDIGWDSFILKITDDDLLIFIHGFNTPFSKAAIRCAQLAHDTNFAGEAVLYSWPSAENPTTYSIDKKRAEENFQFLANFLQDISSQTQKDIHIVAHSMGTYVLMNSLAILKNRIDQNNSILLSRREAKNGKVFGQIILAAPDIAQDDYHKSFSEFKLDEVAENFTLYSSENDHVLDASQLFNLFIEGTNQARLGDSSDGFFIINGMDTVDTRQEISPQFFGHSFYANYRSLVSDMHILLKYGTAPDDRMLQKVSDKNGNSLWFIRD